MPTDRNGLVTVKGIGTWTVDMFLMFPPAQPPPQNANAGEEVQAGGIVPRDDA